MICKGSVCFSTMCFLEFELMALGLMESMFTSWTILLALKLLIGM